MGSRALALESLEQTLSVTTDAKQNHRTPHRHSPDRHDDPSMTTPRFACETFAQPRGLFHVKSPFPRDVIDDIEARIAREGWLLQQQAHRFSPLPAWLVEFSARLKALALECGVITDREGGLLDFTQCIVNQYDAGDGLKPHVDLSAFGELVVSVSFQSTVAMDFRPVEDDNDDHDGIARTSDAHVAVRLDPGDVLFMRADARLRWTHGFAARRFDEFPTSDGGIERVERRHRVSITLRTMSGGDDGHELTVPAD
jgi:hypothetical protein